MTAYYQLSNCIHGALRIYEVDVHLLFKTPNNVHVTNI